MRGHVDVVKVLIRNGADVNSVDECMKSRPLHIGAFRYPHITASSGERAEIAKMLLKNGADVNAVEKLYRRTALHIAAQDGNFDVAKVLIQNGADVNAVEKENWTALHILVGNGHMDLDFAKLLVQNGADVNARGKNNWTPLHAACQERDDVVRLLCQHGADVTAFTKNNKTPLCMTAQYAGSMACTLQLLCFGAEINELALEKDNSGLLRPIKNTLDSLRAGNGMITTLMSDEEKRYMWNLAFSFTIAHRGGAFKAYYAIRSFITFHGIFMAPGYELGDKSVWRLVHDDDFKQDIEENLADNDDLDCLGDFIHRNGWW